MAKVLIVVPHDRFRDEEFEITSRLLRSSGHEVEIGSSHHTEAKGHFGMILKPDVNIDFVETDDYDALVFIGGRGVEEYFSQSSIHNLIRNFYHQRKIVCAIGLAVELFVYAGIITGKKVACHPDIIDKIQAGGGYYTGKQAEIDSDVVTGVGERSGEVFAGKILRALDSIDPRRGLR